MTTPNLLSAVLIATSMLSGPAMAREHHPASRHPVRDSYASASASSGAIRGDTDLVNCSLVCCRLVGIDQFHLRCL
jgi:hypothetical protein